MSSFLLSLAQYTQSSLLLCTLILKLQESLDLVFTSSNYLYMVSFVPFGLVNGTDQMI